MILYFLGDIDRGEVFFWVTFLWYEYFRMFLEGAGVNECFEWVSKENARVSLFVRLICLKGEFSRGVFTYFAWASCMQGGIDNLV